MQIPGVDSITTVYYPAEGPAVCRTVAQSIASAYGAESESASSDPGQGLRVSTESDRWDTGAPGTKAPAWIWAQIDGSGNGSIAATNPAQLYALASRLRDWPVSAEKLENGLFIEPAFSWHRPVYDGVLTQTSRMTRNFDPEAYIRHLAECGFTHFEVNGIQTPFAVEPGLPDEYYSQFYTYCAGLNYFVDSFLTRGVYPAEYLEANLNRMKKLVRIGRDYGLIPGMLSFEPRSLPDWVFQQYPTLRGARVDHPFRSHLPRYCLAQDHPVSREHYRELIQNLLNEVPDLEYMSVYTNDSGAGFEHTASLYVGRNGGPYLIREWRNHDKIAQAAAKSATDLLRSWRDAAAEINPEFRIILRIEPFKVEHDYLLEGLGDGLTIEAPSMLVRGYHLPYSHPSYPDQESAAGTIYHTGLDPEEKVKLEEFRGHGFEPTLTYAPSSSFNLEPLLGIPFPRMLHAKLSAARDMGFRHMNANGGLLNTGVTPYWPNPEVIKSFHVDPDATIDEILERSASRWAGDASDKLVECWDLLENALKWVPIVMLYSGFGYPWLRIWVRPFVPNLEAVPEEDRRPFERFMVSTPNNPSINDLGKDVLFELINREDGKRMADQFDANALPRLESAIETCERYAEQLPESEGRVFHDLAVRARALNVWATCLRNVCAWVAGVHGYIESEDSAEQEELKRYLQDMIDLDLKNTQNLLELYENEDVEFMLVSDVVETSSCYGENFPDLLKRKIELTERYRDVEPYIDHDIIWRI